MCLESQQLPPSDQTGRAIHYDDIIRLVFGPLALPRSAFSCWRSMVQAALWGGIILGTTVKHINLGTLEIWGQNLIRVC